MTRIKKIPEKKNKAWIRRLRRCHDCGYIFKPFTRATGRSKCLGCRSFFKRMLYFKSIPDDEFLTEHEIYWYEKMFSYPKLEKVIFPDGQEQYKIPEKEKKNIRPRKEI